MNFKNRKNLMGFRNFCIQEFPFLSSDFDSMTTYELLCKVVHYLNKLGVISRDLIEAVEQIDNKVDDFINNLDLQAAINNFMTELIASGEFGDLLKEYLPFITPEIYGAVGDGVSDDTKAIQTCITNNPYATIYFGKKKYKVTNSIDLYEVYGGQTLMLEGTVIDYDGEDIENLFNYNIVDNSYTANRTRFIGGYIDAHNKVDNIISINGINNIVQNTSFFNFKKSAIKINESAFGTSGNVFIQGCHISNSVNGQGAEKTDRSGIIMNTVDNRVDNTSILRVNKGITARRGPQSISNCHIWTGFTTTMQEFSYPDTWAYYIIESNVPTISSVDFTNCYFDECKYIIGCDDPTYSHYRTISITGGKLLFSTSSRYRYSFIIDPITSYNLTMQNMTIKTENYPTVITPNFRTPNAINNTVLQNEHFEIPYTRTRGSKELFSAEFYMNNSITRCPFAGTVSGDSFKKCGSILMHRRARAEGYIDMTIDNLNFGRRKVTIRPYRSGVDPRGSMVVVDSSGDTSSLSILVDKIGSEIDINGVELWKWDIYIGSKSGDSVTVYPNIKATSTNNELSLYLVDNDTNKGDYVTIYQVDRDNYIEIN